MICYLITNKINDKKYVGITKYSLQKRFLNHLKYAQGNPNGYFQRAICKYGADSFNLEVLEKAESWNDLQIIEQEWIKKLKTNLSQFGYNMTEGGDGGNTLLTTSAKINVSRACIKRMHNPEQRKKVWNPVINKKRTANMKKGLKVLYADPDKKAELLKNNKGLFKKGHIDSNQTKLKKAISAKGKLKTETHKHNISVALSGKKFTKQHTHNMQKVRQNLVTCFDCFTGKNIRVHKMVFDVCDNLVGLNSKLVSKFKNQTILSQAQQACWEGAETTWCKTNFLRNTWLASDNSIKELVI